VKVPEKIMPRWISKSCTTFVAALMFSSCALAQERLKPEQITTQLALLDTNGFVPQPFDGKLQRLHKARLRAAVMEARERFTQTINGRGTLTSTLDAGRRVLTARFALARSAAEQLAIRQQYLEFVRNVEETTQKLMATAPPDYTASVLERTRYARLEAELGLLQYPGYALTERNADKSADEGGFPPAIIIHTAEGSGSQLISSPFVLGARFRIDADLSPSLRLPRELANSAMNEMASRVERFSLGRGRTEDFLDAAQRVRNWRLNLADRKAAVNATLERFRDFQKDVLEHERIRTWNARVLSYYFPMLRYNVFNAEIDLFRAISTSRELQLLQHTFGPPEEQLEAYEQEPDLPPRPAFLGSARFKVESEKSDFQSLLKKRFNEAHAEVDSRYHEFRVGRGDLEEFFQSLGRLLTARLEMTATLKQQWTIWSEYRDLLLEIENLNQARFEHGAILQFNVELSRYQRLTAEIVLMGRVAGECGH
jgi:hypothetical protein